VFIFVYHLRINIWSDAVIKLTLVPKKRPAKKKPSRGVGRPPRERFGIRPYANFILLAIPNGECADGDRIDFFLSDKGFAIKIGTSGERAISKNATGKSAMIPREIINTLPSVPAKTVDLISERADDCAWFFPFSQF
jgi:hypothetical protein